MTTNKAFFKMAKERMKKVLAILEEKSKEYAPINEDAFRNFKNEARIQDISVERAWFGKFAKHFASTIDMIDGHLPLTEKLIDAKIGDCFAYFLLLEGLFKERMAKEGITKAITKSQSKEDDAQS